MSRLDFNKTYSVNVQLTDHHWIGHCLLEEWRDSEGHIVERPADQASITAYDPETGRVLYQRWINDKGKFAKRPSNKPAEIIEFGKDPHRTWYDGEGHSLFIVRPTDVKVDPDTGTILEYVYNDPPTPIRPKYDHLSVSHLSL